MFKRYRRPGDVVFAAVFLGFSLFLLSQIGTQTEVTQRTKWFAQPGLWPRISIYVMVAFSLFHLASSVMSPRIAGRWREVGFWLRGFEYVAHFLIYVVLVPIIGYLIATVIFAVFLAWRAGFRGPRPFFFAALFGVAVVVLFRGFLAVKIPAGMIYEYLPDGLRAIALIYL
jgi:hypothetical protein